MRTAPSQKMKKRQSESRVSTHEYRLYELCRRDMYMLRIQMQLFLPVAFLKQLIIHQIIKRCCIKGCMRNKVVKLPPKITRQSLSVFSNSRENIRINIYMYQIFHTRNDSEIRALYFTGVYDQLKADCSLFLISIRLIYLREGFTSRIPDRCVVLL